MNKLKLHNYNLGVTLLGGQSFAWDYDIVNNLYFAGLKDKAVILKINRGSSSAKAKSEQEVFWQTYPQKNDEEFIKNYLRLDFDYENMLKTVSKDEHVRVGIQKFNGIRILNQDFVETFFGFISSQNRSIKLIRQTNRLLREKFGEPIDCDGKTIYLFPEIETLAKSDLKKLLDCKLGYRAKYVKEGAQYLLDTNLHNEIQNLPLEKAREELLKVNGIGEKVADCILMCGLSHFDVFPLDVWGNRIVHDLYGLDPKLRYQEKRDWLNKYFQGYAAWAGQFLFENIRGFEEKDYIS